MTKILDIFEAVYATFDFMTKSMGKAHQYLGMTVDFRTREEVKISMYDYIKKAQDAPRRYKRILTYSIR